MAIEVEITAIARRGGAVYARFDDGTELETTLEKLRECVQTLGDDRRMLRIQALAYLLKRSSDGTDLSSVLGRKFVLDYSHATPLRTRVP